MLRVSWANSGVFKLCSVELALAASRKFLRLQNQEVQALPRPHPNRNSSVFSFFYFDLFHILDLFEEQLPMLKNTGKKIPWTK